MDDPIIKRSELPKRLGVHTDTVRRMVNVRANRPAVGGSELSE